jgi:ribosomal protection tetracycline resistance protein
LNKILNLGILAHVDAGKTTLTEQILFLCNETKEPGSVDNKTSISDKLAVEKARGISVKSSILSVSKNNTVINIIDTPGHTDFSADAERALLAVDVVLLVISAVEGVQPQTEIILNALVKNNIPFVVFINKIDRVGANCSNVLSSLKKLNNKNYLLLCKQENQGEKNATSDYLFNKEKISVEITENLCELDDYLLSRYLEGELPPFAVLENILKREFKSQSVIPVLTGSAIKGEGVETLIEFLTGFCFTNFITINKQPEFLVINLEVTKNEGKKAFVRMFDGELKVRDSINIFGKEEKITKLETIKGAKALNAKILQKGEVGVVYGLSSLKAGDKIGKKVQKSNLIQTVSVLTVSVSPKHFEDFTKLTESLSILNEENPELNFLWDKLEQTLTISIRGLIHIQVLQQILIDRFDIETVFSTPQIVYKETVVNKGSGFAKYTMPKPCWAVVKFEIEPLERGEGVNYKSIVSTDKIQKKYQNEIEQTIGKSLKQGPLGWEVTDLSITLVDGEDHVVHSNPGDFKIATPMGIMDGLVNCKTTLLEPIMSFKITAPEEVAGKILNDLTQMRGEFNQPVTYKNKIEIKGTIPLATSLEYGIHLSSFTKGKGYFATVFSHYALCDTKKGVVKPFKGVNPLDKSKYILHMRSAIK